MTDWIRRSYAGVGLTQLPPGPYLGVLQERYVGKVILCIDVSYSMASSEGGLTRLEHAVSGAERFVREAVDNHYLVGLILWNHGISVSVPIDALPDNVLSALERAYTGGGTNVVPTLQAGIEQLRQLTGDRVLAVFGDGDLGDENAAITLARQAAGLGIRIIVRGLGEYAAAKLNLIATDIDGPSEESVVVADARSIEGAIASMARGLRGPVVT